jgi:hypothetical protein
MVSLLHSLSGDTGNLDLGELLTMPVLAPVILPPFLLENDDFATAAVVQDLGGDVGTIDCGCADFYVIPVGNHQNFIEIQGFANFGIEKRHLELQVWCDPELLILDFNYGVHRVFSAGLGAQMAQGTLLEI